ncbi:MAG TPA: diphosphomevalonate decarboxylase [Anaerolineae bacterium]|nr:diphosphomevalonate decarboxylase [Anaerolineae bacterium]
MPANPQTATAIASPNIAFIKYWGNRDQSIRLPANGSISMTLGGLESRVAVTFDPRLESDRLETHGVQFDHDPLPRISHHLDLIREMVGTDTPAHIETESNFPAGAGIASSSAVFAALTLAASRAASLPLDPPSLSRLARRGSGSACRSIFAGFVEAFAGDSDQDAFAQSFAPPEYWRIIDLIAIVDKQHKRIGSTAGHALAPTSPLQKARVADAPRRLDLCRQAITGRNFLPLATILEQDSNMMHAVMLTSNPPLFYLSPTSLALMEAISSWRASGLRACYTLDAGPNVHCITHLDDSEEVASRLRVFPGVEEVLQAPPGEAARLV